MKALALGAMALFLTLLVSTFGLISLVVIAAGGARSASAAVTVSNPSEEALEDIPQLLLGFFIQEAQQCPGLPWTVLAGISKVESNHGRFGGSSIGPDGVVRPNIIGMPLNGTNGTARIVDTDDGLWDGDTIWDRAVGPFQFIPGSWHIFGGDGDNDGLADPNNVFDAVPAMRRHLCPDGQIVDVEAAVFNYNRSLLYVEAVLDWARRYTGPLATAALPNRWLRARRSRFARQRSPTHPPSPRLRRRRHRPARWHAPLRHGRRYGDDCVERRNIPPGSGEVRYHSCDLWR